MQKGLSSAACCHYFHLLPCLGDRAVLPWQTAQDMGSAVRRNLNGAGQVEDLSGATRARPVPWCRILLPLRGSCSHPASVSRISRFLHFYPGSFLFAFWDFVTQLFSSCSPPPRLFFNCGGRCRSSLRTVAVEMQVDKGNYLNTYRAGLIGLETQIKMQRSM